MQILLEKWRPTVHASARKLLGSDDDAQDVCQNALIEISLRLNEIRELAAMPGFVRQVVLHQCFDFRRRRATRKIPGQSLFLMDAAAEDREVNDRLAVWKAIDALPELERETVVLDFVEGHRHEEIAEQMSVSVATVRSRLQSAKRKLRSDLKALQKQPPMQLDPIVQQLIDSVYPGAVLESVQSEPETWVPFSYRIALTSGGVSQDLVVRCDVDAAQATLCAELRKTGIPAPRLLSGPIQAAGTFWSLWQAPKGENLSRWTMDGTYHRFRTATDVALDAVDLLQGFTERARELGLPSETLLEKFEALKANDGYWSKQTMFQEALAKLEQPVASARSELVYTNYLHFFPNLLRIQDGKLDEILCPFGRLEDPLLGLAMVWVYDCYPFVHTGFIEQYLTRHDVRRSDFAVRLGVQTLSIVVRECGEEATGYRNNLFELVQRALSWLQ